MRVRVASAGTGKTTSLVLRIMRAIDEGVPLRRIAAVTYTRTAAAELRVRVGEAIATLLREGSYLGGAVRLDEARRPRFEEASRELGGATMATIHGFLMRALRSVAPSLGLDPDFVPYGEGEAQATFEEELRSLMFVAELPGHPLAPVVARLGETAAEEALALFARRSLAPDLRPVDDAAADLWALHQAAYDRWSARMGPARLAPSEIERQALRCVEAPALAARLVARTPLLLVDEFQDVNPLQGRLFEALERAGARVEVVGDPKQSIYGFRQADVEVFRRAARHASQQGTLDAPLVETRRHTPEVTALLNHLTGRLAEEGWGFGPEEAPDVRPAGEQASRAGRVELHWWRDDARGLAELRADEFGWLAGRLTRLHRDGRPWDEIAVIARSHAALAAVEAALRAAGVPAVLRQGRGFFTRPELRDLWHALRVALDPRGVSLAAFLRGPFGGLDASAAAAVARDPDPESALRERAPRAAERLAAVRELVRGDPARAVARLAYQPLVDGVPFVARWPRRARDNVDALVVALAERPPGDLERLVDGFERLARETDAGDVPQAGHGVTLLTVHAAKGLEWPVALVVDAGARGWERDAPVAVDARDGRLARRGTPEYQLLEAERRARAEGETFRALYVALSRPRDELIVTGSQGAQGPGPWLRAFHLAGLGPAAPGDERPAAVARALGVALEQHAGGGAAAPGAPPEPPAALAAAASWAGRVPAPAPFPPVVSPSWVVLEGAGRAPEPRVRAPWPAPLATPMAAPLAAPGEGGGDDDLRPADPGDGERLAGRGTAIGTLVHDALARVRARSGARGGSGEDALAGLAGQEVLFPFPAEARAAILAEVEGLLAGFWELVAAGAVPGPGSADEEHTELPFAFEAGGSTWQGVIDRLTRTGGAWTLDDYKTDRRLDPERYHFAMATYVRAVELVRGVRPVARLIDLRRRRVVTLPDEVLRAAWWRRVGR
ncbi:MAG: UvrD-helicase domain-containing protein [Trueperaceae bacterium]